MPDILQFCRPEEVGVHPSWVENYVAEMNKIGYMCHSFMMIRHNKVFAEGYWKPFHKDWYHRMYSISKSFGGAAIGFLADEGKLKLSDKISDYFPDLLPENPNPLILDMEIRDLLMMATCHHRSTYDRGMDNWIKTFFQPCWEPDHKAGTEFRYDTSGSYTLNVLAERLTGKTFLKYLQDKVLDDIGFSKDAWCIESPEGHAWGGSGVMCTLRDLARFMLLFHNGGKLNGKQYLSEEYVKDATANHISTPKDRTGDAFFGNGYGYQIWRASRNTFAFWGMGGQLAISIPDYDMVVVCNGDVQAYDRECDDVYDNLFAQIVDKIGADSIEADDAAYEKMQKTLASLEAVIPAGEKASPLAQQISGKTYVLEENPMGIHSFEIIFEGEKGQVCFHTERGDKVFPFGVGSYEDTFFPETHYSGRRIGTSADRPYRCMHTAVWPKEKELLVRTYVIDDYFGTLSSVFTFDGDQVQLKMSKVAEWFLDEYVGEATGKQL